MEASPSGGEPLEWQFLQCFGERTPGEEIQEADIISAVEFDQTGQHLATGDRGGRVVLFERVASQQRQAGIDQRSLSPASRLSAFEYRYLTEFQSHEPEFDYLKSLEIEEKINTVVWGQTSGGNRLLLSTNDKTIKLWKVHEKKTVALSNFNLEQSGGSGSSWSIAAGNTNGLSPARSKMLSLTDRKLNLPLRLPKVNVVEAALNARCRRVFANAHTYHINSVSISSDGESFISSDDLRVNLWHMEHSNQSFNIVDMKPANMEDLTEVLTCTEFHPRHCSLFAFSSSKGGIRLADMRSAALCERGAKLFEEPADAGSKSFFSEIISSISNIKFSRDGRYILSRDYMNLKLWDINMEAAPVAVYPVHEQLRARLCDLYENDCIFDKFDCAMSGRGDYVCTGSYSNFFKVTARTGGDGCLVEASRDPLRKRLQTPKVSSRFALRGSAGRRGAGGSQAPEPESAAMDFQSKLLHLAWHPEANVIAAAASNSLYMYCAK